jgi:hypothetical protein
MRVKTAKEGGFAAGVGNPDLKSGGKCIKCRQTDDV